MLKKLSITALLLTGLALLFIDRPVEGLAVGAHQAHTSAAPSGPGILVIDLQDGLEEEAISAFARAHQLDLRYSDPTSKDEALLRAEVPDLQRALEAIKRDPLVELAEPLVELRLSGDYPNDPRYDAQWNLRAIGAARGWRVGGGRGIKVAVLDTGISAIPDLAGIKLEGGRAFLPGIKDATDDHGHGTHVAGTIAQATHNGVGVAGVAPRVTLMPYKVLSASGSGGSDRIAAAIDEAADQGADIINLSLGGPPSGVLLKAAEDAARRGVLVVAAAGNTGQEGLSCPASSPAVIAVSATGPDGRLAPYSTYGEGVEIAAPGGDLRQPGGGILQGVPGEAGYRALQGTSMATPHVSGALAILRGMGLSPRAATQALLRGADARGSVGYDHKYGHGALNLNNSIDIAIKWRGQRFFAAIALGISLSLLFGFTLIKSSLIGLVSAFFAAGVFFLSFIHTEPSILLNFLSVEPLVWPSFIFDESWTHNIFVSSGLFVMIVTFIFGLVRSLHIITSGIALGFGINLIFASFHQSLLVFHSESMNFLFLLSNGMICIVAFLFIMSSIRLNYSI